jgi:hypothetical protein
VKKDGSWGMIDATGAMVLAPQFQEMDSFTDRFVAAKRENRSVYLDHKFIVVWKQRMDCPTGSASGEYKKPS